MNRKIAVLILLSLILGVVGSLWSRSFIQRTVYVKDTSYLPAICSDVKNADDPQCMPLTDSESWGAPLGFKKSSWSYPKGLSNQAGAEAEIDYSFSWLLFMLNVCIWAAPIFVLLFVLSRLRRKT